MHKLLALLKIRKKSKTSKSTDKSGTSTPKQEKRLTKRQEREAHENEYMPMLRDEIYKDTWTSSKSDWYFMATANADAFMKHYAELGPEGIKAEFKTEVEGWKSPTYADTAFHANPTKNADKNVVTCLDESRVKLAGKKYINASWAYDTKKNERKFIIAQAPLPSTLADFWMMAYEQNALAVFALCQQDDNMDDEHVNSIQIWPEKEEETMTIGNITLFRQEWSEMHSLMNYEISVSVKGRKETHEMRVMHFKGWDKAEPERNAHKILYMLKEMDLIEGDCGSGDPFVVIDDHGGIGLASILVVADMIGSMMWKGEPKVTVPAIVKWARRCRHGAIRNEDDYLMVVRTIAERINERSERNPHYQELFEKAFGIVPKPKEKPGTPESKETVAPSPSKEPKEKVPPSPSKEPSKEA